MGRHALLTKDSKHTDFSSLFFALGGVPFVVIHYKIIEGKQYIEMWYGIGKHSRERDLGFKGDLLYIESSVKTLFVRHSDRDYENYVQSNEGHGGGNFATIDSNHYHNRIITREVVPNNHVETILIGEEIREWHGALERQSGYEYDYCFSKLIHPDLLAKIKNKLSDEIRMKINTTHMGFLN